MGASKSAFRQALDERKGHPAALLGLTKCLLVQGNASEALEILDHFPASREFSAAQQLRPLATAIIHQDQLPESDTLIDATYKRALHLISRGNLPAAMDGILAVIKDDKRYRNDEARQVMVSIFEILGSENPITRQYRAELASALY